MTIAKRPLGRTAENVTVLGYGAMELRSEALTGAETQRLLGEVLDSGINLIDTSIDYGPSEELIGRYASHRRDEFFLASKCGCPLAPPPGERPPYRHDYSAANIRAGLEQSLRRLRTDRLDLVQVHASPSRSQLETDDVIGTLRMLRDEGKVRFIGMSGILPHLPDHIAMGVFEVFQIPYSAVQREHEDLITAAAAAAGAGTLIRGGVARGGPAEDKAWRHGPLGLAEGEGRRRWESAGVGELLGDMPRMEFMLRFTISHPALSSTVVGTASIDHLRANAAIAEKGALPPDLYEAAKRRLAPAAG
jgi:aryl-alcohol dehydrogenase-like predicted oxidoreductase